MAGWYSRYLKSKHWTDFKKRYRESGRKMTCFVCQRKTIEFHHITYVRLGREESSRAVIYSATCTWKRSRTFGAKKSGSGAEELSKEVVPLEHRTS